MSGVFTLDFEAGRGAIETTFYLNCDFGYKSAGPGAEPSNFFKFRAVSFEGLLFEI